MAPGVKQPHRCRATLARELRLRAPDLDARSRPVGCFAVRSGVWSVGQGFGLCHRYPYGSRYGFALGKLEFRARPDRLALPGPDQQRLQRGSRWEPLSVADDFRHRCAGALLGGDAVRDYPC
jgi:hypothetical protein